MHDVPQPAEVDRIRDLLLDLYRRAWLDIETELITLAHDPPQRTAVLRRRLAALSRDIGAEMDGLDRQMRAWLQTQFPAVYELGATTAADEIGDRFAWTQHHREAVQVLARRTFDDLLAATRFVRADAKRFAREAARRETARSIIQGVPAARAGRDLAGTLRQVFGTDPLAAVRYSNGARHSLADYADTVLRSTTATAFNEGTLNASAGVEWFEVSDGAACGWTSHDDIDLANGSIRTAAECAAQVIAHPRCARSFGPRPDLGTAAAAQAADTSRSLEAERLAAEERARAAAAPVRLSRASQARRQAVLDRRAARMAASGRR